MEKYEILNLEIGLADFRKAAKALKVKEIPDLFPWIEYHNSGVYAATTNDRLLFAIKIRPLEKEEKEDEKLIGKRYSISLEALASDCNFIKVSEKKTETPAGSSFTNPAAVPPSMFKVFFGLKTSENQNIKLTYRMIVWLSKVLPKNSPFFYHLCVNGLFFCKGLPRNYLLFGMSVKK